MKIVVIGGQGRIGSRLVDKLGEQGHDAVAAGPRTGVDALTGEGLAQALDGADVVVDDIVRLPSARSQPIAADEVAGAVGRVSVGAPANGIVELAGPEPCPLEELIRQDLSARNDPRHVVADPDARYFGTTLVDTSLLPGEHAQLGETRFEDWLGRPAIPG